LWFQVTKSDGLYLPGAWRTEFKRSDAILRSVSIDEETLSQVLGDLKPMLDAFLGRHKTSTAVAPIPVHSSSSAKENVPALPPVVAAVSLHTSAALPPVAKNSAIVAAMPHSTAMEGASTLKKRKRPEPLEVVDLCSP
jgi:hypothetical protein